MKRLILVLLISISSPILLTGAVQSMVSLSGYTIPVETSGAEIGSILLHRDKSNVKLKLKADTSKLFSLNNGVIKLKTRKKLTSSSPTKYEIVISVGKELHHFVLVKDDFIKNRIIAHRGAWKHTRVEQNSVRSFLNAVKIGCEGSEFDVWLSVDSIPVLSHDPIIGGLTVEKSTAEELENLCLTYGDNVPKLEDFIKIATQQNQTKMILEIKSSQISQDRTLFMTDKIVEMVHRLKAQAWVEYISFNYEVLKRIIAIDPSARTAYLSGDKPIEEIKKDRLTGIDYSYYSHRSDSLLTQKSHQLGLTVNVWTVNEKSELAYYLNTQKVDYITTDEPEILLNMIKNKRKTLNSDGR